MKHSVGLDVSVKETAICIVDEAGKVVQESKVATEPEAIIALLSGAGVEYARIGLEAGPLSQWLVNGLAEAGLPVICVETRHMKAILKAQQVNKSDRNDARGIAQMMRVGLYKPVHVKTLASQQRRMLLTSRKLLRDKLQDMENELRGTEPRRDFRRPQLLRGWSHDEASSPVFSRGPYPRGSDGAGPPRRARLAMGGDPLDCREDRLLGRDAASLGAAGRA